MEYPFKPPKIKFFTPNGRFKVNEFICMSFTHYHPESWSTSWTLNHMIIGLISFIYTKDGTLGGVIHTQD